MNDLSQRVSDLPSEEKRALLAQLLKQKASQARSFPLSYAQERLWFLDQLEPASTAYNLPVAVRLSGRLNLAALAQSIAEVVRRHESLRTSFASAQGRPIQVISKQSKRLHLEVDLLGLSANKADTEAGRLASKEAQRPFDLNNDPLLRSCVLRLNEQEFVLLLTMHHIVSDGWSMGVLTRELIALYKAFAAGESSSLAELEIQYRDFAVWQRDFLKGDVLDEQLAYWVDQLRGAPPVLDLPTDFVRPGIQSFRGATQSFTLSEQLSASLRLASQREGVTLFMLLLAAFQVLMSRYSGQEDLIVGTPVSGRTRLEIEPLIGFFVNTLVLRTRVKLDDSFRNLLAEVKERMLAAWSHQDVPYELVVETLQPDRDLSHMPVVQVMFALQNMREETVELPDLQLRSLGAETTTAKFDLSLVMMEAGAHVLASVQYNCELYEEVRIARMMKHYENVLEAIVADPNLPVGLLEMLDEQEREQLLAGANGKPNWFPREGNLAELFEEQVGRGPDSVAVVDQQHSLTYFELNQRANQLAHFLLSLEVGPETLVAVSLPRSAEMIIALLAVVKAGAAYLPLDPDYPPHRLNAIIEQSQAPVLLTQRLLSNNLPAGSKKLICIDSDWPRIAEQSTTNPVSRVQADNLAYVIYTSGSTGQPKGVAVTHRAVNRLVINTDYIKLNSGEVMAQLSNSSFDAATFEVWGALLNGARLVVISKEVALSGEELAATIKEQQLTTLFLTTALFNQLVEQATDFSPLHCLLFGGEAVEPRWVARILNSGAPQRLLHVYGPTETTTFATWQLVEKVSPKRSTIPIGQPITNTEVYLLDRYMEPVAVGITGHLYIGGEGLARGYMNEPELSAERFIPHPYGEAGGERLYRTGDLGRYNRDGAVEFLGRVDNQVKVRGFRIELGEIEAVLRAQPGVSQAVVVVREKADKDEGANKRLIAYLVSEEKESGLSISAIRCNLRDRLPHYMQPSAIVTLDEMPLTENGKVDRRALPAPDLSEQEDAGDFIAARTPVEDVLAGIWAEILGVQKVSMDANFFEIGGHSLLATQLISRVRDRLSVQLSLRSLFEFPSVAEMARNVETAMRAGPSLPSRSIVGVPRGREIPLSFGQERMWFLHQLQAKTAAYTIATALRIRGELNVAAFDQAVSEIIRRHEALRTTFHVVSNKPTQEIAPFQHVTSPVISLAALTEAEREAQAVRLATEEVQRPFDLEQGPLLRMRLARLGATDHLLLFSMHHIISDGWSMGALMREVTALYETYSAGTPSSLAELPIQYADFAHWQREWLRGEVLDEQLQYWKERLGGAVPVLEMPTKQPRPTVNSLRGAAVPFRFNSKTTEELRKLSRREDVTLFMTLLAAFQTLLYRYTGQNDVVVGTPIANRQHSELEPLIGFFVNTLVLRSDLSGAQTFRELLKQVREVTLGAYMHQDMPFEKLIEELQPERDLSRNPLFQVTFALQNAPTQAYHLSGLTLSSQEHESTSTRFDLELHLREEPEGLGGSLVYNADLFDETMIRSMLTHFETLLNGIIANPATRISSLPLLTDVERQRQLVEWNSTQVDFPHNEFIHHLFARQVERAPDAIALVAQQQFLTYRELNGRANQLARYLQREGVGAESIVAVCLERSPEMVIALLSILKAGGAYLPLDPEHPPARVAYILAESRAQVLLIQRRTPGRPADFRGKVLCLDSEWAAVARQSAEEVESELAAENLAYVIYTSGSTGQPKGVAITHSSLMNLGHWYRRTFALGPSSRASHVAGIGFDAAVMELWSHLTAGVSVHLPNDETRRSPIELQEWLVTQRITHGFAPTPVAEALLSLEWPAEADLQILHTGGDQLRRFPDSRLGFRLVNDYGPTENTVVTTFEWVAPEQQKGLSPTIGRPIDNVGVYLLDQTLRPVPVGVAAELYASGAGLARGYLHRAELTAENFIPHPLSSEAGTRLYRTGDLAHYLPSGKIECLGRVDYQVKVRGFRIELGEIEAALQEHPAISQAVVVARAGVGAEKRLVAYVVGEHGPPVATVHEIGRYLKQRLPQYMTPSAIIVLDELPLTPNGKVDRRALPEPEKPYTDSAETFVAPRTPTEEMVAAIWAEILKLEQVSVHDDFFDLGGHSLLATQVTSRLRQIYQIEIPLRVFFESATVAELAEAVDLAGRTALDLPLLPIQVISREGDLPLSFGQQRLWFFDRLQPNTAFYNLPAATRVSGLLNLMTLKQALNEVAKRHEALRTTFVMAHGQASQVIAETGSLDLPLIDLSHLTESERETEVRHLAKVEAGRPFDLTRGPLIRLSLLRLGLQSHVILLTMHHIIIDAWSMDTLMQEISSLYEAYTKGQVSPLPELAIQYADYAVWQHAWLEGEAYEKQLAYWRQQLAGAPETLSLPTDRPRPAMQSFRGSQETLFVSPELTAALKALGRREGATLFMTLLAAFQKLLSWYAKQDDVVVGCPIAGRNRIETEPLIGFFVNTLALRTHLTDGQSFRELLRSVRNVTLGAYAHQDMPFEKLVEELAPERSLSHTPLFQVVMGLTNKTAASGRLTDLTLEPLSEAVGVARFDLELSIVDTNEGLQAALTYNADLFESDTIKNLLALFESVLNLVVTCPDATMDSISELLSEANKRQQTAAEMEFKKTSRDRLKSARRRAVLHEPV